MGEKAAPSDAGRDALGPLAELAPLGPEIFMSELPMPPGCAPPDCGMVNAGQILPTTAALQIRFRQSSVLIDVL
jgi:hypothetical protein